MKSLKYIQFSPIYPRATLWCIVIMLLGSQLIAQTPNDPRFLEQTYLNTINIQDAWSVTTGEPSVSIAIISEGGVYANHEDLQNKVTVKTNREFELFPLGTISAGVSAAETNNGKGIAGINWEAPVLSYDVATTYVDEEEGTFYGLDQGVVDDDINAAVSDGADILFLPFKMVPNWDIQQITSQDFPVVPILTRQGWQDYAFDIGQKIKSIFEADNPNYNNAMIAMRNAYQQGRTLISPMDDYKGITLGIPNRLSRDHLVISVGSTEDDGSTPYLYSSIALSNSSAQKTDIDLVAPGDEVLTTSMEAVDSYVKHTTTTAAGAQVTGVASLLKSADPDLTPNDIREILRRTAVDIGDPGYDIKTGFGRVDAKAAFDFWQDRTFTRGTATQKLSTNQIAEDKQITLYHGVWGDLASATYTADIYEVKFKIDIPSFHHVDIWFRAKNTLGWSDFNPNYQRRHATVEEINQVEGYAILKTYIYGDIETYPNGQDLV